MPVSAYDTDLTDEQWALIAPLIPPAKHGGRPRTTDVRRVADAIMYFVVNGVKWRNLPHDFPPWETVYTYFVTWRRKGIIRRLHEMLVKKVRQAEGRSSLPTIAIIDAQSVKTGKMGGNVGYDGGKHTKGRKRHIAVDMLGLVLGINVTPANVHDQKGARKVTRQVSRFLGQSNLKRVYVDGGYQGEPFRKYIHSKLNAVVDVAKGLGQRIKGFLPEAKRWVVERTFGWLGDYRRLDKDQERLTKNSVAMIRLALIRVMLLRLEPPENRLLWAQQV